MSSRRYGSMEYMYYMDTLPGPGQVQGPWADVWRAAVAQRFDQWFGALNELGGQVLRHHFRAFLALFPSSTLAHMPLPPARAMQCVLLCARFGALAELGGQVRAISFISPHPLNLRCSFFFGFWFDWYGTGAVTPEGNMF